MHAPAGAHQEKGRQALTIIMSIPLASSAEMPRLLSRFSGPSIVDTPGGTALPFRWSVHASRSVFSQSASELQWQSAGDQVGAEIDAAGRGTHTARRMSARRQRPSQRTDGPAALPKPRTRLGEHRRPARADRSGGGLRPSLTGPKSLFPCRPLPRSTQQHRQQAGLWCFELQARW